VRQDGDKPATQALMDKYAISGYPTFVIFAPAGEELARFNSLNSAEEFVKILDELDSDLPGHKELTEAKKYLTADDIEKAAPLLKAAREKIAVDDPKLEDVLNGLLECSKGDQKEVSAVAHELIDRFPNSVRLPDYYKKLADTFQSSIALKRHYLETAARLIEKDIDGWVSLSETARRVTAEEYTDLLAEIYKDVGQYSKVASVYGRGAELCERLIEEGGGLANNRYLITAVAYYYTNADEVKRAMKFLKKAQDEVPDYWPVYSGLAKTSAASGDFQGALVFAKKAYDLAEEVAKPRVALVWADIYAGNGYYDGAISVIKQAEEDIRKTGSTDAGRSKKIFKQLQDRREEYERQLLYCRQG
jgi:tetratricopeptide (TPR) repeat protein